MHLMPGFISIYKHRGHVVCTLKFFSNPIIAQRIPMGLVYSVYAIASPEVNSGGYIDPFSLQYVKGVTRTSHYIHA